MPFWKSTKLENQGLMSPLPKTVFIHVGHGKTGSSFLQSSLANSSDALGALGIAYPSERGNIERTKAGGISSGNLLPTPQALRKLLRKGWSGEADKLLLSSEGFFYQMQRTGFLEALHKSIPDAKLKILLYIRDPLDHVVSSYHQSIKRGNGTGEFEAALKAYNGPQLVADFLTFLNGSAEITILNYSRHSDDLTGTFEHWLGVPRGSLVAPPVSVINRSLTNGEAAFLRPFNDAFGAKGAQFLADPLCEKLPHIKAERPHASPQALRQFLTRIQRMIEKHDLDARITGPERYRLEVGQFTPPEDDPIYHMRQSQIELIAREIIKQMKGGS